MLLYMIYTAADWFLRLISLAILIYCVLTWVAPRSAARYWLERFISPFSHRSPLGAYVCMRWGSPFDLTCFFALIGVNILSVLLGEVYKLLVGLF